jgi:predicted phage tail component-like protein
MANLTKISNGFSFNSVRKDYVLTISKNRPYWAPIKRSFINIPGIPGAFLDSTETEIRVISIEVTVSAESGKELKKTSEDFAAWLITKESCELIFDDEPDRIYYAVVDGSFDPEEIVSHGFGTITFLCPDPYKYASVESKENFIDSGVANVSGTTKAFPITKVTVKQDTTFLAISNGEKINIIGQPIEVTQQPIVREERKLWNEMGSLTGWLDTTSVEEGKNLGVMSTNGYSFGATNYGTDPGWHGPAKKISIGSSLQDFQVDALIIQKGDKGQVGSVEIALLDASNSFVAKMLMTKRSVNSPANWARLRAGTAANGYDIINNRGANDLAWANFDGILRIGRIGNTWYAYVSKIDSNGKFHTSMWRQWIDSKNISPSAIAQVQVQLWQYGTVPPTRQNIVDLKVYKINSPEDNQLPIIARAGDIVEFDHINDIILRNGEEITKYKQFIGDYFSLNPGANAIVVEPAEAIESTELRWRDGWL